MEENGITERFLRNITPVEQNVHLLKSALLLCLSLLKSVGIFNRSDCKAVWFFNALAEVISHPSHLHSCGWYTIKAEGQIPLSLHTAPLLQLGS